MSDEVAVIGAGIAGLAAARALADTGRPVRVFDKSRGIGGRLATRRTDFGPIDHGAPGVPEELRTMPGAQAWPEGPDGARLVGSPGMSSLVRGWADGLDVRTGIAVAGCTRDGSAWRLTDAGGQALGAFRFVILALPAPQATVLVGPSDALQEALAPVRMTPLWTLLVAFASPTGLAQRVTDLGAPLARAVPMLAKPGQSGTERWAVHADEGWSAAHLDMERADAADLLLSAFRRATGITADPSIAAGHRWRYARVAVPLGRPFATDGTGTLLAGGDWALGPLATHAAESGRAMARAILGKGLQAAVA